MRSRVSRWVQLALGVGPLVCAGCASDFDTSRTVPPRGTLGRELFTVVCDRVGAQALREDVTGASFRDVCHADSKGKFKDKVDPTKLPPLTSTTSVKGEPVSLAVQQANRPHNIARIEALARRRADFIAAIDSTIPDANLPRVCSDPKGTPGSGPGSGTGSGGTGDASKLMLQSELSATLGRLVDLYEDDTIPGVTRGLGALMEAIKANPDAQAALARLDGRRGYRPLSSASGLARPLLAYPKLVDLIQTMVAPLVADPAAPGSHQARAFQSLTSVLHEELRTAQADPAAGPLTIVTDPRLDGATVLSRPRTLIEGMRDVLTVENPAFAIGGSTFIVRRDPRGYAAVPTVAGVVPAPFVDRTGPAGVPDGLPDVDTLGRFVTAGADLPSPFFTPEAHDGARDGVGRALAPDGTPAYRYIDTRQTLMASLVRDFRPLFAPDPTREREAMMNVLAALPVLAGARDPQPTSTRSYEKDPKALERWKAGHTRPPPAGLGTTPVTIAYRAFHPDTSPIVDLVYAAGQIASRPEIDDLLLLIRKLTRDRPDVLASFVGLALEIKAKADKHPEASLPEASTFWDDLFARLVPVVREPGLAEDILRAVADKRTIGLEKGLATYMAMKDDISYDPDNLNGPLKNMTTGARPPNFVTPVDRNQPDSGPNRSQMQRFLSLLHDTNGLAICTKPDAVVHINGRVAGISGLLNFDYPKEPILTGAICAIAGKPVPTRLETCGLFAFENVMTLMLDVLLAGTKPDAQRARLVVNDPCLKSLLDNKLLTGIVGGPDNFLEDISGVTGFTMTPNLAGFARLLYFQTPYPGLPSDPNPANKKTNDFLRDTIDPIPSIVCPLDPFSPTVNGITYKIRKCNDVRDVLRARDPNALFPIDEKSMGFVEALGPLALAFDKHKLPLVFANLFDVLHLHYGSSKQTKVECNPSLPRTDGRWCAQSGLVSYEPLIVEILKSGGVFARIQSLLEAMASTKIARCTSRDRTTGLCAASSEVDGLRVVADALNVMFDAKRSPGLKTRSGETLALRNDGTRVDPVTPMGLLVDAFKEIDASFGRYAAQNPGGLDRQVRWKAARSQLVDAFLAVDGSGPSARFRNEGIAKSLHTIIDLVRAQIAAHCPTRDPACAWAREELAASTADALRGPTFAASIDLLDAMLQDDTSRVELERLITYLLDPDSANEAQAGALAAAVDSLQVLDDDVNLVPFFHVLSEALGAPVTDDSGKVLSRGLVDSALQAVSKIYPPGECSQSRDPNGAIRAVLANIVTPMGDRSRTPLDVIADVIADVNRAEPQKTTKLEGRDYASLAEETRAFLLDQSRGLEQMYAVIKQATAK